MVIDFFVVIDKLKLVKVKSQICKFKLLIEMIFYVLMFING